MSSSIENLIQSLKNYQSEGMRLIVELTEGEGAFRDHEEALLQRFVSLWQDCERQMASADFQGWGGHHPLYGELKVHIEKVTGILSSIISSLERKKVTIQKILEELPHPPSIQEERSDSIFEVSV